MSARGNNLLSSLSVTLLFVIGLSSFAVYDAKSLMAKDNGDIFIIEDSKFLDGRQEAVQDTTLCPFYEDSGNSGSGESVEETLNFNDIVEHCNSSYIIPMEYLSSFNATGVLPDEVDKTGMCFLRCFYEMSGFLQDWKLNTELIREYMWPATGDTIPYCEQAGVNEPNACVRAYSIVKCLMIRAIVDAHYV